jgi:2'-5' RNA ligase
MVKGFMPAKDMVRAFVAVEISDAVRQRLADEQARLGKSRARVSWVAPEKIHLTLAFLGDVLPEQAQTIGPALDGVGAQTAPLSYTVAGLGYFGSNRSPRVVWAGITKGADRLGVLQQRVGAALRALGFALESRPFRPHLTLGRVRSSREAAELAALIDSASDAPCGVVPVDRVLLMRSELRPQGAVYSVLHVSPLAGGEESP